MIPNQPKAYYYVCSNNGICWGPIRTPMVIRYSHDHSSLPVTPANSTTDTMIQYTQTQITDSLTYGTTQRQCRTHSQATRLHLNCMTLDSSHLVQISLKSCTSIES